MYELIVSDQAKKQLAKLNSSVRNKIGANLERIVVRPHKFIKRLYNNKYYRIRVDNYRIILDVKDTELIILVVEIGHRKNIYKK